MIVNSVETLQKKMAQVRAAQAEFAKFTQEQVDEIFSKFQWRQTKRE